MAIRNVNKFVEKGNKIHQNKYDYSIAVTAKNCKDKTTFICPIHGNFQMTWDNHLNGKQGCPKCSHHYNYTTEEWIEQADKCHHHKYDYSETNYTTARNKVTVICHEKDEFGNEHGKFYVRAGNHLIGIGCPKCGNYHSWTNEEWILKANKKHNYKYDYSRCHYVNNKTNVTIICHEKDEFGNEHGEFLQNPTSHLSGCGCPKCNGGVKMTLSRFTKNGNLVHDGFYDYSKFEYINAKRKGIITCPIHGDFYQTPDAHLRGEGCPKCAASFMEKSLMEKLRESNIFYIYQYKVIVDGSEKRCDFYIPSCNLVIECQGEQHFIPVCFGNKKYTANTYKCIVNSDKDKYQYLYNKGFNVIYYIDKTTYKDKTINIHNGFYADKNVVEDIEAIINFINDNSIETSDNFNNFCEDVKHNITNGIVIKSDYVTFKNNVIKFVRLAPNHRDDLNSFRRYCMKKGKKVFLVYEDEYVNSKFPVFNQMCSFFNMTLNENKIEKSEIKIKDITEKEAKIFLNKNHIQGFATSTSYIGAYNNDLLIGVMTFIKRNKRNDTWELNRFAFDNITNYQSLGYKLFNYFIQKFNSIKIISFADKRWTDKKENIYETLGFTLTKNLHPNYHYVLPILTKNTKANETSTETQIVEKLEPYKMWNCGIYRYEYEKNIK